MLATILLTENILAGQISPIPHQQLTTGSLRSIDYSARAPHLVAVFQWMQDENLNFPNNYPFGVPSDTPEMYSEIHSPGSCFRDASKSTCRSGTSDVPLPLMLFIDKGPLCLVPVTFTHGIFNRHVCNQPKAWRDLGFIPNQAVLQPGDGKGKDKCINKATYYHYILGKVLEGLAAIEKNGGRIRWDLNYRGSTYKVIFQPFFFPVSHWLH